MRQLIDWGAVAAATWDWRLANRSLLNNLQQMFQKRRKIQRLDFILAGAQKSGTTALHYFLAAHPKITMGDQQEMHFFDDDAMFASPVAYEQLQKHYPALAPSSIAGDCTPSYIYYGPAMERIWQYN